MADSTPQMDAASEKSQEKDHQSLDIQEILQDRKTQGGEVVVGVERKVVEKFGGVVVVEELWGHQELVTRKKTDLSREYFEEPT